METLISIPSASLSLHVAPSSNRSTRKSRPSICLSSSASSLFSSSSFKSNFNSSVYGGAVEIRNRRSRKTERNKSRLSCTCLFGLGVPELVVIAGVAALVFGPKKLPDIGRSIGKTVKSFQQAAKEFETELKKEPDSALDSPVEKTTPAEEGKEEIKATSIKESL